MAYVQFVKPKQGNGARAVWGVYFSDAGSIRISRDIYLTFFSPAGFASLWFDSTRQAIGIKPEMRCTPDVYLVRPAPTGYAKLISGKGFIKWAGIGKLVKGKSFVPEWNDKEGLLKIQL